MRTARVVAAVGLAGALIWGCKDFVTNPSGAVVRAARQLQLDSAAFVLMDGDTFRLKATVLDQNSSAFTTLPADVTLTWSSSATSVATVDAGGLVTGVGPGQAQITSTVTTTSGSFAATATANVIQPVVRLVAVSGGGQQDTIGATLTTTLAVKALDAAGRAVATVPIQFAAHGGSVSSPSVTTDPTGVAQVSWTLPTVPGLDTVLATTATLADSVAVFVAHTTAGLPVSAARISGDGQSGTVGAALGAPLVVKVTDRLGDPVVGNAVTWAAASGSGSVAPSSSATDVNGRAQTTWTLGTAAGGQSATAAAAGVAAPATFSATAAPGAAASIIASAGGGQTVAAGAAVAVPPAVTVKDAYGNVVPGVAVTFAVTAGGGSVTGASQTTNASGVATVGSWTLGAVAGADALTATAAGAGITGNPVTFSATAVPGAAASIAATAGNGQSAAVNTSVAIAPAVVVKDAFGNPVAGVAVAFAVTAGGGNVTGASQTTNASGVATVGSWTLGTVAGADAMTATATGAGITGNPVTFSATGTAGPPASIAVSAGNAQTATVNTSVAIAPAVVVKDAFGNPVAGVAVAFAVTAGGGSVTGASQTTNASGVATVGSWTMGTTVGLDSLSATATGSGIAGNPALFGATAAVGAPASIAVSAGNNQTAQAGAAVATAPAVVVKDALGNPVAGVVVTFAVASGGGSLTGAGQTTNASGVATAGSWTLGASAGTNTLTATATGSGIAGNPVTFTATATTSAPPTVTVSAGNGETATVGAAVAIAPAVIVKDGSGNPMAGVGVTFAVATGGGSVTGGSQTTGANGVATVGSWTLGTTSGANTLTATATPGGISGNPVTFTATGIAGAAASIAVNGANSGVGTPGTTVPIAPSVIVKDAHGNPVAGVTVTFTVTKGGGSVTGASQTTNASGIATVGSWTLGTVAGPDSLSATATGSGISGNPALFGATVVAGQPASISVNAGNAQSATVGTNVGIAPAVIVKDAFGNPDSGVAVTFAVATGGGSVTGATPTTGANGVATVGSWKMGSVAGLDSLTATATGSGIAGNPVRFGATAVAGAPASIAISAGNNQSATVGTAVTTAPAVIVKDAGGNPVPGVTVTFAVATGGGSVTGATPATGANGVATVGSWKLGAVAGTNTLTATATGSGITGNPVTFTATGNAIITQQLRTWVGGDAGGPTNWSNPNNWSPVGAPTTGDTALIPATTNSPFLSANVSIAQLRQTGDSLVLNGHTLTVGGPLSESNGGLIMRNAVDSVIVTGTATFSGGDETGRLTAGVLVADGNFSAPGGSGGIEFDPSGTHTTVLAGTQPQSVNLTYAGGNGSHFQNLVLAGSGAVSFASRIPVLGNAVLTGTGAVTGSDTLYIGGNFTSGAGTSLTLPGVEIGGALSVGGTYSAGVTNFVGSGQTVPVLPYTTVAVTGGPATAAGALTLGGKLIVRSSGALTLAGRTTTADSVIINANTLTVGGNTLTAGTLINTGGALVMTSAHDSVIVAGNATFQGGDESGKLTAGVLAVDGNFTAPPGSGGIEFNASGTHTTVLAGATPQTVSLAYAGGNGSHFENLVLAGAGAVTLSGRIPALGNAAVTGTGAVSGGDTLYVGGSLTTAGGTSLTLAGLEVGGALSVGGSYAVGVTNFIGSGQAVPVLPYATVASTGGTATAAGGLTLGGNLIVRGSGSLTLGGRTTADSVIINSNTLTVGGNTLAASGSLINTGGAVVMTSAQDSVIVTGNATFQGGDETGKLTAGVLEVYGNLTAPPGSGGIEFNASGTHTTVLPGAQSQTVSLTYAGGNGSHFQNLVLAGAGPINFAGRVPVLGNATLTGTAAVTGTDTLYVGGNLATAVGTSLTLPGVEIGSALNVSGTYAVGVTNFIGSGQTIPAASYTNVFVTGGPASLASRVTIPGNLTVTSGGTLTIGGHTLAVGGSYNNPVGGLVMTSAQDSVIISGSATFSGGDETGRLTAGVLEVVGNFTAPPGSGGIEFNASGTHTTVLAGTQPQTVNLTYAGVNGAHFQDLVLAGSGTVTLSGRILALGNATVTGTGAVTGNDTLYVGGNLTTAAGATLWVPGVEVAGALSAGGTYLVTWTNFIGTGQTIPNAPYQNLAVTGGPATLATQTVVIDTLNIKNTTLTVNGQVLGVSTLVVNNGGTLVMTNVKDSVAVLGNATFQAGDETGKLTAGVLVVQGSFSAPGGIGGAEFNPSGTHLTVLAGTQPRTVNLTYAGGNGSHFQNLEIVGTGAVTLSSRIPVLGNATILGTGAVTGSDTMYVAGNLTTGVATSLTLAGLELNGSLSVGGAYAVGVTNFIGSGQTIPAVSYTNVFVTGGPASLASRVVTTGNLSVTSGGTLTIGGHTLAVGGSYNNPVGGLVMTNAQDSLIVSGNATFSGGDETGKLTAGVLVVDGNFSAPGGSGGIEFNPSGTHTTVLSGTQPQSVSLTYAAGNGSHFQNLVLGGTGAVTLSGRIPALGNVSVTGTGAVTGSDTLYAGGNFTTGTGTSFIMPGLEIGGALSVHGLYHANVTNFFGTNQVIPAIGTVWFDTLAVTGPGATTQDTAAPVVDSGAYIQNGSGSLRLVGPALAALQDARISAGTLDLNGHVFAAVGTLVLSGSGVIVMTNATDTLAASSVSWGGADETGKLTAGYLGIFGGSFVQTPGQSAASFVTSGTFTVLLSSTGVAGTIWEHAAPLSQQISLYYSGNANFTNLDLSGDTSGVVLNSNVTVTGVLSDTATVTHNGIAGNGYRINAGAVNIASEILDHTLLFVNGPLTQFDNVTFQNYAPGDNQFSVATNGTYSLTGLTFSSTPVAGHYVSATASGGALNITISSNLSPSAAALLTQLIGSATVTWM